MGIYDSIVKMFTGKIDKKTQHIVWTDETVKYTSSFIQSVVAFIAREFSKLDIDHRIYERQPDGKYLTRDKLGSNEYEVLNYSPNGYKTNVKWKREIAKRLMHGDNVYLKPIYKIGNLIELLFTDAVTYSDDPNNILCITSPIFVSENSSMYDNILTNIGSQLKQNKLRGFLKINTLVNTNVEEFNRTVQAYLKSLQESATYNGLGVLDAKTEIKELQKEYSTLSPDMVELIKREILNGFGFSEKLLTGEYTEADYRHFFDNVMAPIVKEFETELTYKLLTNNARINTGDKKSFERISVSVNVFKFAGIDQLIKLASSNTNGAFMTVNEIRSLMGHDPIEGGDVFRTNLNSTEVKYGND